MNVALYKLSDYLSSYPGTSGQDEANPVFSLATRAGKVGLSCPLGISSIGPARRFSFWSFKKSFISQGCSVSRWLDVGLSLAFFIDLDFVSVSVLLNNEYVMRATPSKACFFVNSQTADHINVLRFHRLSDFATCKPL